MKIHFFHEIMTRLRGLHHENPVNRQEGRIQMNPFYNIRSSISKIHVLLRTAGIIYLILHKEFMICNIPAVQHKKQLPWPFKK